jgi:hypothetical protein
MNPLDGDRPVAKTSTCTTYNIHNRQDIHATGGIRTRNPSKRAVADPRLRPRGHLDRLSTPLIVVSFFYVFTCSLVVMRTNWQSSVRTDIRNRNLCLHSVNDFPNTLLTFSQPPTSRTGGNKIGALRPQYVTTVHLLKHRTETDGFIITSPVICTAKFHLF